MSNRLHIINNDDPDNVVELTFKEAGKVIGRRTQLVCNWYRVHGCRTMKDIRARAAHVYRIAHNDVFYETCRGTLNVSQIAAIILKETGSKLATVTLHQRMKRYPHNSVVQFFEKAKSQAHWMSMLKEAGIEAPVTKAAKSRRKIVPFDSTTFCRRNGFEDVCKHYSSCLSARTERRQHHARYKDNGTCYSGKPLSPASVQSGGRNAKEYLSNGSCRS